MRERLHRPKRQEERSPKGWFDDGYDDDPWGMKQVKKLQLTSLHFI